MKPWIFNHENNNIINILDEKRLEIFEAFHKKIVSLPKTFEEVVEKRIFLFNLSKYFFANNYKEKDESKKYEA